MTNKPSENLTDEFSATSATLRVTYGEVDQLGIVYYANFFRWFEVGRAEFLRARGKSYKEFDLEGFSLPVIEAHAQYKEPAKYDDLIQIITKPEEFGPVRVKFCYKVVRKEDGVLLADGYTIHVCVDPKTLKIRKVPESMMRQSRLMV